MKPLRITHAWVGALPQAADYSIGEAVKVHAMGTLYLGSVVEVSRTRIKVAFVTGTGRQRVYTINPSVEHVGLMPADGAYKGPRAYRLADDARISREA